MPEEKKNPLKTSNLKDFDGHQKQNVSENRHKIISLLRIRGPSLPIHISREINLPTIFAGAFLSELASNNEIKISNMKIGSSPLYFLPGQEPQLEKFHTYLLGKEREAFLLLKQKKILQDSKQQPAIRVALRNLKDFAIPLAIKTEERQELFWRFYTVPEHETKELGKFKKPEKTTVRKQKPEIKKEERADRGILKRVKEKSEFVKEIVSLFIREKIEIVEEKEQKKKEYIAVIKINSDIGKIPFLLVAREKKTITESDLSLAIQKAQSLKMPALFISGGEPNKKALAYLEQYSGLIKFKRYKKV